jgi:phosphoglucomutase/phosphopentomutase
MGVYISVLQNPLTLESVKQLIAEGNKEELQKCFGSRMEFGTAGLRAPMGAGISQMNDLTIIQTTQVPDSYIF